MYFRSVVQSICCLGIPKNTNLPATLANTRDSPSVALTIVLSTQLLPTTHRPMATLANTRDSPSVALGIVLSTQLLPIDSYSCHQSLACFHSSTGPKWPTFLATVPRRVESDVADPSPALLGRRLGCAVTSWIDRAGFVPIACVVFYL